VSRKRLSIVVPLVLAVATGVAWAGEPPKWGPHIDLEGKPGTKRHLGEADMFIPLAQDGTTLLFADLRTRMDDKRSREGNFGLGLRHMMEAGWNLGGYGFYDRRQSPYGNIFNQATLGVEALSSDWDLRANGYMPLGSDWRAADRFNTATLSGTTVVFRSGEERALAGFDAEIGWRVPAFGRDAGQQVRLYAGGYRFASDDVPEVKGPRGRAEIVFDELPFLWRGSRLALGVEAQYDGARGTQGFGAIRLRIPLQISEPPGSSKPGPMERRMADPIVRDVDIVAQAGAYGPQEAATQLESGTSFTVLNSSSTSGANLPGTVAAAAASTTFVMSGTFNTTALTQLQSGQSMMAGSIVVRSPSGRTATLTTSATISGSDAVQNVIQLAGNNTLSGMTITGTDTGGGLAGVLLNNTAANINVLNNTINLTQTGANAASGIAVGVNTGVVVSGNRITVTGSGGATTMTALNVVTSTATVSGNTLSASGGTANRATNVSNSTINSGSTGNVKAAGVCNDGGGNTGSLSFTDGSTCP
jgi:hypothetical protein